MVTSKDTTDRSSAPRAVADSRSGRRPFLRLPSRLALTGIRTRILLGFVAMLVLATVASVVVAREVLQSRLDERIDDDLAQRSTSCAGSRPATTPPPDGPSARTSAGSSGSTSTRTPRPTGEAVLTFVERSPVPAQPPRPASYRLDRDAPLVPRCGTSTPQNAAASTRPAGASSTCPSLDGRRPRARHLRRRRFTDVLQHPYNEALAATGVVGLAVLLIGSLLAWLHGRQRAAAGPIADADRARHLRDGPHAADRGARPR